MFTSIVGIGIANILMAFASHVSALSSLAGRRLGATWLVILLLTYLGMFWNSTLLIQRDDWSYSLFLFVIIGPVFLLFASSLMTRLLGGDAGGDVSSALRDRALFRFFLIFALVQAWFIGMDFVIGNGWETATTVSAVLLLTASGLVLVRHQDLVRAFTVAVLAMSLADIVLT